MELNVLLVASMDMVQHLTLQFVYYVMLDVLHVTKLLVIAHHARQVEEMKHIYTTTQY